MRERENKKERVKGGKMTKKRIEERKNGLKENERETKKENEEKILKIEKEKEKTCLEKRARSRVNRAKKLKKRK
jgi:ketol-acid reductoisomerase